jgi:hypothetical protein
VTAVKDFFSAIRVEAFPGRAYLARKQTDPGGQHGVRTLPIRARGPRGHGELTLYLDGQPRYGQAQGHHLFMCVSCASKWARHYEGGGSFRWEMLR